MLRSKRPTRKRRPTKTRVKRGRKVGDAGRSRETPTRHQLAPTLPTQLHHPRPTPTPEGRGVEEEEEEEREEETEAEEEEEEAINGLRSPPLQAVCQDSRKKMKNTGKILQTPLFHPAFLPLIAVLAASAKTINGTANFPSAPRVVLSVGSNGPPPTGILLSNANIVRATRRRCLRPWNPSTPTTKNDETPLSQASL